MADTEQPLKTYRGNCHCGAFVYEAQLPEIKSAIECNCSICRKKGYLGVLPGPGNFKVVKGSEEDLSVYTFGPGTVHHKFCPTCGTPVLARRLVAKPGQDLGLNTHAIQGVNTWVLERIPVDGNAVGPEYSTPQYTGPEPSADAAENPKTYHGSCHCGAVTLALKSVPLDKTYPATANICNCSICERNASIWIYPKVNQVVFQGTENLVNYSFARKIVYKTFCKICGVAVNNAPANLSEEEYNALDDEYRGWVDFSRNTAMFNLRLLNDYNVSEIEERTARLTVGSEMGPKYVNP